MFGKNENDIFEPEDEYFGGTPPVMAEDEPEVTTNTVRPKKIDGRSKEARAAKGILAKQAQAATNGHGLLKATEQSPGMVTLNQEQLSKLWQVITGGQIKLSQAGTVAHVSLDSFEKALPVLLERL